MGILIDKRISNGLDYRQWYSLNWSDYFAWGYSLRDTLERDLKIVCEEMPSPVLEVIQRVPIYINRFGPENHIACFHTPSNTSGDRDRDITENPRLGGSIEIFLDKYLVYMALVHEFSHAYHCHIGDARPDILVAFWDGEERIEEREEG